ncbi:MAG TPA: ribonuclease Y [Gemmatales bacterium]|nr:ribonuclease Y [Gemmatales bacterium]
MQEVAIAGIALVIGLAGGYALRQWADRLRKAGVQKDIDAMLDQAKRDAETVANQGKEKARDIEQQAKDGLYKKREEFNKELQGQRNELKDQERRVEKREESIDQQQQALLKKEKIVDKIKKEAAERREQYERRLKEVEESQKEQTNKLLEISGMSREDAGTVVLSRIEQELAQEIGKRIQKHEEGLKGKAETRAKEIIATAVQRYAAPHTADTTVSTVDIPSDEMKGRIIGREGRNIRTFEKATGVDVIVDDTPGVVVVSAFDNVRRETAKLAMQKLIADGRIHPTRIEEIVTETKAEMEKAIMEVGQRAVMDANVGPVHDKLVELLGRLKFRTSYSQNVLLHTMEVTHIAGLIAEELGYDGKLARRCGLLHDIGKAADHEMEGGHPQIGAELAKRYGETNPHVLHAIVGHHDDIRVDHIYTVIVAAADAISASRPGARRDTLEKYVKRLEELESIACGFHGIDQAFAIQAGREVRVIANSEKITDQEAQKACRDIAKAIEEKMNYPGEIKISVIRETRYVEYAK